MKMTELIKTNCTLPRSLTLCQLNHMKMLFTQMLMQGVEKAIE